jgi:hypothetical protein
MAVIGIKYRGANHDYDEDGNYVFTPGQLEYQSVYLHYEGGEKIFDSGDFPRDWFQAKTFYAKELMEKEPYLSGSSTCDHFHMDGAEFDSAYLHMEGEVPILKYLDMTDPNYILTQREIFDNGWEFFVEPGEKPTWEELKEKYKSI